MLVEIINLSIEISEYSSDLTSKGAVGAGGEANLTNLAQIYLFVLLADAVASVKEIVVVLLIGVDVEDQMSMDQKYKEPKNEPNTAQKVDCPPGRSIRSPFRLELLLLSAVWTSFELIRQKY
ncbi:hypothetical protein EVAR_52282_1 [Eumeta japonica]|uniref:Uncharacterized protein n=1 Tax=Eumeta variegata TaxID=151549 RepID=A0A4C1ZNY2_EUMVA|nr:hypothetical protein EVAR_52282_1 [Eumeta japonica]